MIQEVTNELGLFEGVNKAQEKLPEPLKKAILKKQEEDDTTTDSEDESLNEGNAWGAKTLKRHGTKILKNLNSTEKNIN